MLVKFAVGMVYMIAPKTWRLLEKSRRNHKQNRFIISLITRFLSAGAEPELKFMCQNLNNKTNILITFYERQQQKLMEFHNYYLQRI